MDETGLKNGMIVTYEDEGEVVGGDHSKNVTIIPAYKFFTMENVKG
jgi:hypothetical protein